MNTKRLTTSQALVLYLANQMSERDGQQQPFFAGVWGIFGHGNVAGLGQALQQYAHLLRFYQSRNEQAQVLARNGVCESEEQAANLCLHLLDRAWRDKHAHGRGGGDGQSIASIVVARRHFRRAHPGAGAAAS